MPLTAAFQERLEQMDRARKERLSLLQVEKENQESKSQIIYSKYSNMSYAEQRCLMLEEKIASQKLKISVLKSEIDSLDNKYSSNMQKLRNLKNDVVKLEELKKGRNKFYAEKSREIEEFKNNVSKFVMQCRIHNEELRSNFNKLVSNSTNLQGSSRHHDRFEVAAAETLRRELLTKKRNIDCELASNHQIRGKLMKVTSGSQSV
ncbi:hypothetical protein SAY87_011829 [Trapa incisa]|uniref:Uncharacterized protein n=1 Tax=Trapa incisa TaxID=236973 RepID=A0AAN7GSH4_9MYRT|nr:hypothetical protein SAY87_011829 [Trapa incisa]